MVERKDKGEQGHIYPSQTQLINRIVSARKVLDIPSLEICDNKRLIEKREQALDSFNAAVRIAGDCRYNVTALLRAAEKRLERRPTSVR